MNVEIKDCIIEHLSQHDALCVDNFGLFLVKHQNAQIDFVAHIALPPSKTIIFNSEIITHNDRLENILILKYAYSQDQAHDLVEGFVKNIKAELYSSGSSNLAGLGTFYLSTNFIRFEQDVKFNINNNSFGLPKVNFDAYVNHNHNTKLRPAMQKNDNTDATLEKNFTKGKRRNMLIFAIVTPLFLGLVSAGFLWENRQNENYASFNPFSLGNPASTKIVKKEKSNFNYDDPMGRNTHADSVEIKEKVTIEYKDSTLINDVATNEENFANEAIVVQEKIAKTTKIVHSGELVIDKTQRFYIVGASFVTLKKAEEFATQLETKGLENIKIIQPHGSVDRYRISLNDFETQNDASKEAKTLRAKFGEDIWVYKY